MSLTKRRSVFQVRLWSSMLSIVARHRGRRQWRLGALMPHGRRDDGVKLITGYPRPG